MLVEEFIFKMENDEEFKNKITTELKTVKSNFSKEEILKHKEEIQNFYHKFALEDLFSKLKEYSLLKEDWDGYGAEKPNQKIINNAKEFLVLLMKEIKYFPKVMIGSSGAIAFYFELNKKNYIEIEIEENSYLYFVKTETKGLFGKEDLLLEEIDLELIESINLMYK